MTEPQDMTVLEYLRSVSRPVTYRAICAATDLPRRYVEAEIQLLRLGGVPVITDSDGARLAQTPAEAKACSERLRSRALRQLETAAALADAAERMESPLTLGLRA